MRSIARRLGRSPSTISRETGRKKGPRKYRAVDADDRARHLARRPKLCLLARNEQPRRLVSDKPGVDWSPDQITGYLRKHHEPGAGMRVSHETIYGSLFVQARGGLARNLLRRLRWGRPTRRKVHNTVTGQWEPFPPGLSRRG
jgi:IS30 family transposase